MKKLTCLFALGFLLFNNTLRANEPEKVTSTEEVSETAAKKERIKQVTKDDDYEKFRFGGYGEMVAKFMNYGTNRFYGGVDNSDHRNTIAIPRFVLAFDYKFNSKWILGAEIEFEAGGVGLETELENSENGEYETEMEKGGEVALEQFHITRLIHSAFNIRAGHLIVPMGLTHAHHEPMNFFKSKDDIFCTVVRPVISAFERMLHEHHGRYGADIMEMYSTESLCKNLRRYIELLVLRIFMERN